MLARKSHQALHVTYSFGNAGVWTVTRIKNFPRVIEPYSVSGCCYTIIPAAEKRDVVEPLFAVLLALYLERTDKGHSVPENRASAEERGFPLDFGSCSCSFIHPHNWLRTIGTSASPKHAGIFVPVYEQS